MRPKSTLLAFILWLGCLVGLAGLHRFYLGLVGTGFVWLLTWGLVPPHRDYDSLGTTG